MTHGFTQMCGAMSTDARQVRAQRYDEYDCPRCGDYSITRQAAINLESGRICSWIRCPCDLDVSRRSSAENSF